MIFSCLVAVLCIVIPGALLCRTLGLDGKLAVVASPAVSAAYYATLGIAYDLVGIRSSLLTLLLPVAAICGGFLLVRRIRGTVDKTVHMPGLTWPAIALYCLIGALVGYCVFVRSLPSGDNMIEAYDAIWHVDAVRHFVDSGKLTSLNADPSAVTPTGVTSLSRAASFYPCAWHCISAVVAMAAGRGVIVAMNATNCVFASIVLPLSACAILSSIAGSKRRVVISGAAVCLLFAAFPWWILIWGPLFPNAASLAACMAVAAVFVEAMRGGRPRREIIRLCLVGAVGLLGLVLLQTNAVFVVGIFVAICAFAKILAMEERISLGSVQLTPRLAAVAFLVSCCCLWAIALHLPFLQGQITYDWPSFTTPEQAVVNILSLAYVHKFMPAYAQLGLGALVLLGVLRALARKSTRWICLPYALAAFALLVNSTTDGRLKQILTGFWYNDPYRIASVAVLFAIPLAAYGLALVGDAVEWLLERFADTGHPRGLATALVCAAIIIVTLFPTYDLPGFASNHVTAFDCLKERYSSLYRHSGAYSEEEADFVKKVKETVGDDALILNNPGDGSVAAYGFDGLNVYFRELASFDIFESESDNAWIIRTGLSRIEEKESVRKAVEDTGAQYLMLLSEDSTSSILQDYRKRQWNGIRMIDDQTPGFELVLSDGDMRLYKIVP